MSEHLVLDLEIKNQVQDTPGGWDATDKLGVAVACVYSFSSRGYTVYFERDVPTLKARVLNASRVTTWNGWRFDLPVLFGLPAREHVEELEQSSDDILRRAWRAAGLNPDLFTPSHKGFGLGQIARATIGQDKIGNGADAPLWFREGRLGMVVTYCLDDVRLTKELCDFVDRYGYVVRPEGVRLKLGEWRQA